MDATPDTPKPHAVKLTLLSGSSGPTAPVKILAPLERGQAASAKAMRSRVRTHSHVRSEPSRRIPNRYWAWLGVTAMLAVAGTFAAMQLSDHPTQTAYIPVSSPLPAQATTGTMAPETTTHLRGTAVADNKPANVVDMPTTDNPIATATNTTAVPTLASTAAVASPIPVVNARPTVVSNTPVATSRAATEKQSPASPRATVASTRPAAAAVSRTHTSAAATTAAPAADSDVDLLTALLSRLQQRDPVAMEQQAPASPPPCTPTKNQPNCPALP